MFFKSRIELDQHLTPTTVLNYNGGMDNGIVYSTVTNDEGEVLIHSTLSPTGDKMIVTDFRNNTVREEEISVSYTLEEITEDMRSLGYLSDNEELEWI